MKSTGMSLGFLLMTTMASEVIASVQWPLNASTFNASMDAQVPMSWMPGSEVFKSFDASFQIDITDGAGLREKLFGHLVLDLPRSKVYLKMTSPNFWKLLDNLREILRSLPGRTHTQKLPDLGEILRSFQADKTREVIDANKVGSTNEIYFDGEHLLVRSYVGEERAKSSIYDLCGALKLRIPPKFKEALSAELTDLARLWDTCAASAPSAGSPMSARRLDPLPSQTDPYQAEDDASSGKEKEEGGRRLDRFYTPILENPFCRNPELFRPHMSMPFQNCVATPPDIGANASIEFFQPALATLRDCGGPKTIILPTNRYDRITRVITFQKWEVTQTPKFPELTHTCTLNAGKFTELPVNRSTPREVLPANPPTNSPEGPRTPFDLPAVPPANASAATLNASKQAGSVFPAFSNFEQFVTRFNVSILVTSLKNALTLPPLQGQIALDMVNLQSFVGLHVRPCDSFEFYHLLSYATTDYLETFMQPETKAEFQRGGLGVDIKAFYNGKSVTGEARLGFQAIKQPYTGAHVINPVIDECMNAQFDLPEDYRTMLTASLTQVKEFYDAVRAGTWGPSGRPLGVSFTNCQFGATVAHSSPLLGEEWFTQNGAPRDGRKLSVEVDFERIRAGGLLADCGRPKRLSFGLQDPNGGSMLLALDSRFRRAKQAKLTVTVVFEDWVLGKPEIPLGNCRSKKAASKQQALEVTVGATFSEEALKTPGIIETSMAATLSEPVYFNMPTKVVFREEAVVNTTTGRRLAEKVAFFTATAFCGESCDTAQSAGVKARSNVAIMTQALRANNIDATATNVSVPHLVGTTGGDYGEKTPSLGVLSSTTHPFYLGLGVFALVLAACTAYFCLHKRWGPKGQRAGKKSRGAGVSAMVSQAHAPSTAPLTVNGTAPIGASPYAQLPSTFAAPPMQQYSTGPTYQAAHQARHVRRKL